MIAVLSAACAIAATGVAPATADEVGDYQGTWVDRALDLQYELGFDVPLRNANYVGTHNSFNSVAEMGPTLSAMDSNQQLGLVDQLDVDVRSIELDLHRFPSAQGAGFRPVVCHALGGGVGCTVEKDLAPILAEISGWLRRPENSEQVLLLYLEDDLDTARTHDDAAAAIEASLGDLIHRPEGEGCQEVSTELTRDEIRDSGKRVLIVSGCGKGDAWQSLAFSWEDHRESRPFDFEDFPGCGPDYTIADSRKHLIRYFEDSTKVTRGTGEPDDGLIPETVAAMVRCGIDLVGLDQLAPFDGRLEGLDLELGARTAEHRPLRDQQGRRQVPIRPLVLQAVRLASRASRLPQGQPMDRPSRSLRPQGGDRRLQGAGRPPLSPPQWLRKPAAAPGDDEAWRPLGDARPASEARYLDRARPARRAEEALTPPDEDAELVPSGSSSVSHCADAGEDERQEPLGELIRPNFWIYSPTIRSCPHTRHRGRG